VSCFRYISYLIRRSLGQSLGFFYIFNIYLRSYSSPRSLSRTYVFFCGLRLTYLYSSYRILINSCIINVVFIGWHYSCLPKPNAANSIKFAYNTISTSSSSFQMVGKNGKPLKRATSLISQSVQQIIDNPPSLISSKL
jgi:hypothetical protein